MKVIPSQNMWLARNLLVMPADEKEISQIFDDLSNAVKALEVVFVETG